MNTVVCPPFDISIDKLFNVWTIRLTPSKIKGLVLNREYLYKKLTTLNEIKFPRILAFREISKAGVLHFAVRFVSTVWKNRSGVKQTLEKLIPELEGNSSYSTHKCYINGVLFDDNLMKSLTYTCKDGDLVFNRGYIQQHVDQFIEKGSVLAQESSLPLYKKISKYIIKSCGSDLPTGRQVMKGIIDYYKKYKKTCPPQKAPLFNMLHNIKYEIDEKYRMHYAYEMCSYYDNLGKDHTYI